MYRVHKSLGDCVLYQLGPTCEAYVRSSAQFSLSRLHYTKNDKYTRVVFTRKNRYYVPDVYLTTDGARDSLH